MLIDTTKLGAYADTFTGEGSAIRVNGQVKNVFGQKNEQIRSVIGDVLPGDIINFTTKNRWSVHEMLVYLLQLSGPAKVYISTWSISEEAARTIVELRDKGIITEIYCLFDKKVTIRNPVPLQLCMGFPHLALTEVHAKVTVIENDRWSLTLTGSANYNKNRRIETGVIFNLAEVAEFNKQWILREVFDKENRLT